MRFWKLILWIAILMKLDDWWNLQYVMWLTFCQNAMRHELIFCVNLYNLISLCILKRTFIRPALIWICSWVGGSQLLSHDSRFLVIFTPFFSCLSLSQSAAKMIKESMDKKFGSSWHVVIGEGFGFEVTHEVKNLLYMFFGGSLAVCVWKCS